MREQDLLRYLRRKNLGHEISGLELGIGDDCALLQVDDGGTIATSTDMLVEGVHYSSGVSPHLIGRKAIARALSDLAAMACRPVACLVAVSFPPSSDDEFGREICDALCETANQFRAPLVGGDISSGTSQMVITVTVFGAPGPKGFVRRSGAEPGDGIYVTGQLGGAVKGGRHLRFRPRIPEALALSQKFDIHAMIDISDGMSTDLCHLCESSGVGATIDASSLPVHPDLKHEIGTADPQTLVNRALSDGEDYEILFCLAEGQIPESLSTVALEGIQDMYRTTETLDGEPNGMSPAGKIPDDANPDQTIDVARVGTCTSEESITIQWNGSSPHMEPLEAKGWEHRT
jgi:thiamine-monophosphate kinase